MKARIKQNAFVKFICSAGLLYLVLYLIYQFVVRKYTHYDQKFIGSIISVSEVILNLLGYETFKALQDIDLQVIGIDGGTGVWIGPNCNAITLFSLFAVFVITYPGHQKAKLWYVPLGIVAIHFLNILRVVALVIINHSAYEYLDFNHTYTFTFIVYTFIFLLWIIWVNKFSNKNSVVNEN
ncbi:MAG: hypothetical protein K0S32_2466 [Bacteroidetes bacterium]|jgi:exosortase family protein XrtF|nr:hypothetical protein [Bacteroidota bacterium]